MPCGMPGTPAQTEPAGSVTPAWMLAAVSRIDNPRQPDREGRAAAGLALDRDVAAHHLTEAPADREPKPGAAVFARRRCVGLRELLKQLPYLFRRHSNSRVGDRD